MKTWLPLLIGLLALAVAIHASLKDGPGGGPATAGGGDLPGLADRVEALSDRVEANADAQRELAGEIEILRAVLAAGAAPENVDVEPAPPPEASPQERPAPTQPAATPRTASRFDASAMVEAGFSPDEVDAYQAYLDGADMRHLRLRDEAERDGWLATNRFRREREALAAELAAQGSEFSEELRDWALYTSGVPNRLRVRQVLSGSPAAAAGLQSGDVLIQYADNRLLRQGELRRLTSKGEAGSQTLVTVLRGGDEVRVYVPRGPLGVRLEPFRSKPPAPR